VSKNDLSAIYARGVCSIKSPPAPRISRYYPALLAGLDRVASKAQEPLSFGLSAFGFCMATHSPECCRMCESHFFSFRMIGEPFGVLLQRDSGIGQHLDKTPTVHPCAWAVA
jgi:hypothetical protein